MKIIKLQTLLESANPEADIYVSVDGLTFEISDITWNEETDTFEIIIPDEDL